MHIYALWIMSFGCIQPIYISHLGVADYCGYTPKATRQPAGQPSIHWSTTTQLSGDVKVFCVSVDGKMTGGHEYVKLLESVAELHSILEITCLVYWTVSFLWWWGRLIVQLFFCENMKDVHMKSKSKEVAIWSPDASCYVFVCRCVCVFFQWSLHSTEDNALEIGSVCVVVCSVGPWRVWGTMSCTQSPKLNMEFETYYSLRGFMYSIFTVPTFSWFLW